MSCDKLLRLGCPGNESSYHVCHFLLICDDSALARKQLLQSLPAGWPVTVCQAATGLEALERIRQGGVDVMLLDLTMPELDGYQVLAQLREEQLQCKTIVISADIQDEAVRRVLALGALAFIKKPADPVHLHQTLASLGLLDDVSSFIGRVEGGRISFRDTFREVVNVAMGRAAALLARVLGVFIQLPIPNVNILEVGELHMALADAARGDKLTAVCQGYIGVASPVRHCCCSMTRKSPTWHASCAGRTWRWRCCWICRAC